MARWPRPCGCPPTRGTRRSGAACARCSRGASRTPLARASAPGRSDEARAELAALAPDRFAVVPFDANWMSAMAVLSETALLLGERDHAAVLRELLTPYAGSTTPAGRATAQYGLVEDFLGRLGLLLGASQARGQLERALRFYERHGWEPFARRARAALRNTDQTAKRPLRALDRRSMDRDRRIG